MISNHCNLNIIFPFHFERDRLLLPLRPRDLLREREWPRELLLSERLRERLREYERRRLRDLDRLRLRVRRLERERDLRLRLLPRRYGEEGLP